MLARTAHHIRDHKRRSFGKASNWEHFGCLLSTHKTVLLEKKSGYTAPFLWVCPVLSCLGSDWAPPTGSCRISSLLWGSRYLPHPLVMLALISSLEPCLFICLYSPWSCGDMETHKGSHRAFRSTNGKSTVNPAYQSWKQWPQVCVFLVPLCTQCYIVNSPMLPFLVSILLLFVASSCIQNLSFLFDALGYSVIIIILYTNCLDLLSEVPYPQVSCLCFFDLPPSFLWVFLCFLALRSCPVTCSFPSLGLVSAILLGNNSFYTRF